MANLELTTLNKIEYLQAHGQWDDPAGDMDPKELSDFCRILIETHEISEDDILEWVRFQDATVVEGTEIREESVQERVVDVTTQVMSNSVNIQSPGEERVFHITSTQSHLHRDIGGRLYGEIEEQLASVTVTLPILIGPKTLSRLLDEVMGRLGNLVTVEVQPVLGTGGTRIHIGRIDRGAVPVDYDIHVTLEMD